MHVQTQYPIPEFETYISNNTSGKSNENDTYALLTNETFEIGSDYYPGPEMMRQDSQQTARGVCLVIFIAIGTALNVFMVVAVVPNRRLRTVRNILLVHLGCAGLLSSYLVNLVTAVVSFTGKWFGGIILCQIFGYTMSVVTLVTTWTIAALSWDKYQTIASPLHHSFTATAVKMFVCFSVFWTVACSLSLPPLLGGSQFIFLPDKGICFVGTKTITGKIYIVSYMLAAIYIPLGIMLYCYTHIYKIARTQSSRIAATMIRMTCVIQATIAPGSQANNVSVKGTKAMCTIFQLIGAFVLVYIPISVILLTEIISSNEFKINGVLSSTFAMLFHSAPVINSSVYGLRNKILRASFQRYLRRKLRYYCYKDKRKNSIKSVRSSSFKTAMLHRKHQQNGGAPALRRTQSFPVRGARGGRTPRVERQEVEKQNGGLTVNHLNKRDSIPRPHSFNVLNTEPDSSCKVKFENSDDFDDSLPEDIPAIDADYV